MRNDSKKKDKDNFRWFEFAIEGIVQGVGFRPFVYNFAQSKGYKGSIRNTSSGVIITVGCEDPEYFLSYIKNNCPPLAQIYSININELIALNLTGFSILNSTEEAGFTHLSPDISVCSQCLSEMTNPSDRRYIYPFINCINCGPRYSIIRQIPYDRPNTTMSVFQMCNECLKEYNDPSNRRFHAQPNACPACGPRLNLIIDNSDFSGSNEDIIKMTINLLKRGAIIALKGIGGFHLACDARNEAAVSELRARKRRVNKPFALMSADLETIKKFCEVSKLEASLLEDKRNPIVLLKKNKRINLPDVIAPKNRYLGFMLPYTPLHHLLFNYPEFNKEGRGTRNFSALVMTSGNFSEEPIVINNDEAVSVLTGIADALLIHDRDIFIRVDDSVVKLQCSKPSFIRRARGYVPQSVNLLDRGFDVVGCGADLKNTFTIVKDGRAVISHHIGDLENIDTLNFFQESFDNLRSVYKSSPIALAHDLHPGYHSSKWALKYSGTNNIKSYPIQHHYAHIASVMAERNLRERVIGIALDGNGYGTDGNLWGGEFLICDMNDSERFAHLRYIPLPGGEMAIRESWRCAVSYIKSSTDDNALMDILDSLGFIERYGALKIENILKIADNKQFSPLSSSAGRLFDAVSALIGICYINTFEGESAIALESILDERDSVMPHHYPYEIKDGNPCVIDFSRMILCIVEDIRNKESRGGISLRFHNTIVEVIKDVALIIRNKTGINKVALSGGVFQNKYIIEKAYRVLSNKGFEFFFNERVPCNDAGISLGQAYILNYKINGVQNNI